jgi:hypothetical protein
MTPPINRLPRVRPVPDEVLRQLTDLARVPGVVDVFAELLQPCRLAA